MKRLALLLAVVPCVAFAQYLNFKMISTSSQPFNLRMGDTVSPNSGLAINTIYAAVDGGVGQWNSVACAAVKMRIAGGAQGTVTNPRDSYDTFSVTPILMTDADDPDFQAVVGGAVVALTIPRAYSGVLQTCDIYFNNAPPSDRGITWSTSATTPSDAYDFQTTQVHELGHCLGLDEADQLHVEDVMFSGQLPGEQKRVLTAHDIEVLCERYPVSGSVTAICTGDGGCDANLKCVAQPQTNGVTVSMCTHGCTLGVNDGCELPLSCVGSSVFPASTGACMLPGSSVTLVGRACNDPSTCGSAVSGCQTPIAPPSGPGPDVNNPHEWWQDGYCTQECSSSQACPSGAECLDVGLGTDRCLQTCRVGFADCRAGYVCLELDENNPEGVCVPRCFANNDCGAGYECRTCDGQCIATGNPLGTVGTACDSTSDCGAGLKCIATATGGSVKQCTQPCALGCGLCPTGSTCTAAASGQLVCMKNCEGKGLCPQGGRCIGVTQGRVCQTPCNANRNGSGTCPSGKDCCAVGDSCGADGECYPPDGGPVCPGCHADGGQQYVPGDGGTGPNHNGTGGCGCSSAEPVGVLLAFLVLMLRRRSA